MTPVTPVTAWSPKGPAVPAVVGRGALADHLAACLATGGTSGAVRGTVRATAQGTPAATTVLVAELDSLGDFQDTVVDCLVTGRPLLFVGTWRSLVYIGPVWVPGAPGCPHCLVTRTANSPFGPGLEDDSLAESWSYGPEARVWGPGALRLVEHFVRALLAGRSGIAQLPCSDGQLRADGRVVVVDGATGTVERQVLLADSACPSCGVLRGDTAPVLAPREVPLTKITPSVLRTRRLDQETVRRDYLFPGLGLFKELRQDLQSPFGACSVELPARWGRREPAIGRAADYGTSRTVAVLEGLERYAGLHRGGAAPPVRARYAEVADRALYPPDLGTHPEESYRSEGFRYRAFDPATEIDWVWAYSFRRDDRVLVPERAAFWGPRHDAEISFFYDTSNGCALGNSVEEAVLHGLRELAERDAFLLTWYRQLALPEVAMEGADPALDHLLAKAGLFTGFGFRCFNATMEYGIPALLLTAESEEPGAPEGKGGGPRLFAGCGSHPDPVQAVAGGLYELVGTILATRDAYERRRPEALRMLDDPYLIRRMEDHSTVGALPEARGRFSFLLDRKASQGKVPEREASEGKAPERGVPERGVPEPDRASGTGHTAGLVPLARVPKTLRSDEPDLRADLYTAVAGILDRGLDVLVVDQTMPELARNGLSCVRVLVPGLIPMTFGHRNRRTRGLPRLTDGTGVPYRSLLAPGREIGAVPHPFP
ncbi:TOMM precursor leader peptide-binding protein [Streptomyces sp. NPDC088116]|uniref:TOMM precursor leader peptide-binding protein n=1 Tax=Streptomyces sp. NPDC088116 TaxID=3365825 RepID=UPI00380FC66B